jgi:triosephosphate isomerase
MNSKKTLVATGFKMKKSVKESVDYAEIVSTFVNKNSDALRDFDILICPSFISLYPMLKIISNSNVLILGAQDCWYEDRGPYTGEVSPLNLKEIGCSYVEIGHPERRDIFNEDSKIINKKVAACVRNNLKPILFVNEKSKLKQTNGINESLKKQLLAELKGIELKDLDKVIIAYEPGWAIGAEKAAPVSYIEESLYLLREFFNKEFGRGLGESQFIFYGGSVNIENAKEIIKIKGNDGIASSRGSLDPNYFIEMIKIAVRVKSSNSFT